MGGVIYPWTYRDFQPLPKEHHIEVYIVRQAEFGVTPQVLLDLKRHLHDTVNGLLLAGARSKWGSVANLKGNKCDMSLVICKF